jgi:hypothetical protein
MIVCDKCGGTDILEFRAAGYDPNKYNDHDFDVPIRGGVDYPVEYTWCYDCDEEVYLMNEEEYNAKDNGTE